MLSENYLISALKLYQYKSEKNQKYERNEMKETTTKLCAFSVDTMQPIFAFVCIDRWSLREFVGNFKSIWKENKNPILIHTSTLKQIKLYIKMYGKNEIK